MRSEKHTAVVAERKSLPDSFGVACRVAAASAAAAGGMKFREFVLRLANDGRERERQSWGRVWRRRLLLPLSEKKFIDLVRRRLICSSNTRTPTLLKNGLVLQRENREQTKHSHSQSHPPPATSSSSFSAEQQQQPAKNQLPVTSLYVFDILSRLHHQNSSSKLFDLVLRLCFFFAAFFSLIFAFSWVLAQADFMDEMFFLSTSSSSPSRLCGYYVSSTSERDTIVNSCLVGVGCATTTSHTHFCSHKHKMSHAIRQHKRVKRVSSTFLEMERCWQSARFFSFSAGRDISKITSESWRLTFNWVEAIHERNP